MIETGKLCPKCTILQQIEDKQREDEKAEETEVQFRALESLNSAARFLESDDRKWPEDGKPVPSDYINMAAYLNGLTGGD